MSASASLRIVDENLNGEAIHEFTLDSLAETMTVREVIRARVYQEVEDYNRTRADVSGATTFNGLVQPEEREATLNAQSTAGKKKRHAIDWESQFDVACKAFGQNSFFVIVGDRQAESLDESFRVGVDTSVSFVKLLPLVGG